MSDRDSLMRMLRAAAKPKSKRRIVCYDSKWAGLPPITVYVRPRRSKVGRRKRERVAARPILPVLKRSQVQLSLPFEVGA